MRGTLLRPPRAPTARTWEAFILPLNYTRKPISILTRLDYFCTDTVASLFNSMIIVHINGASRVFDRSLNVAQLIQDLALSGKKLAIERNGELVPRSQYAECHVVDGDRLEIVVAVGGG